ncbi:MAG: tetratricopeptide repeat protein [Anaerolineae bacterium]|nr:tetratricopeptide repeat protein [Anaerolineae bacterium]NUQ03404.1 tetratricopeptide repeat protein [Anaerolineae bacterium]
MSSAKELQERGVRLFQHKDYEEAAQLFHQAREAYDAEGKPDMAAEMRVNIGLVHRALGEHPQALAAMQEALQVFQGMNDRRRLAMVLGNMGGVYAAMRDNEQAHASYRAAADLFDELGETKLHGETLVAMGALQVKEGKLTAGAASYQVGLEELNDLSASQKVIKGLSGIVNRLTGGQKSD